MKTFTLKGNDVKEHWHVLDAAERPLGRLATDVVRLLRGKHRPTYTPHLDNGDHVIVVNASKIVVTGSKMQQKVYRRHSGYPGGLKETPIVRMLELHPERIVQQAVKGMLPHNKLGRKLLKHLKVYGGPDHPHEAQVRAGMAKSSTATPNIAAKKKPDAEEPVEAAAVGDAPEETEAAE